MTSTDINNLTPEQEALLQLYQEKWIKIALSTEPIDREKAAEAVKAAYTFVGEEKPEVRFFDSPHAAFEAVWNKLVDSSIKQLPTPPKSGLEKLLELLETQLVRSPQPVEIKLVEHLGHTLEDPVYQTCFQTEEDIINFLNNLQIEDEEDDNEDLIFLTNLQIENDEERFDRILEERLLNPLRDKIKNKILKKSESLKNHQNNKTLINFKAANSSFSNHLISKLKEYLNNQKNNLVYTIKIKSQLENLLEQQLRREIESKFWNKIDQLITPESWSFQGCWWDYCTNVLNNSYEPIKCSLFQYLLENCGWIIPFGEVCYVCDRPIKLSFDSQHRLHAEGEPAIQFSDGYSIYAYDGVILPEKYGKVKTKNWQQKWVVEEENEEVRRILMQGIGYERICTELEDSQLAHQLDSWDEYTLLQLDIFELNYEYYDPDGRPEPDLEPVHLLKMNCPSTGFIKTLRVPPDMRSAKEAIRWVNEEKNREYSPVYS